MPFVIGAGFAFAVFASFVLGPEAGRFIAGAVLALGALPYAWRMARDVTRGQLGVDIISLVAIFVSLVFNQYISGGIILFMLAGGEALEEYALARARSQLTRLFSRAPSVAHRKRGGKIRDIRVEEIGLEDELLVKRGETVPTDGLVLRGEALIDESMVTGEPLPVEKKMASLVVSGTVNVGDAFWMRATRVSSESNYQQIVRLVQNAESNRAPIVRLADHYSFGFTIFTFSLAGFAWLYSGDPLVGFAVMVVATPCPLIIATPTAIMSGISVAAKRGIVVKNGGALETLDRVKALVFDKTGTITFGEPSVADVQGYTMRRDEVLRIAASLDQISAHVLARSLVAEAARRGVSLELPTKAHEVLAQGIVGDIDNDTYVLGKEDFLESHGIVFNEQIRTAHRARQRVGQKMVFLGHGKMVLGSITFSDRLRPETAHLFEVFKRNGLERIMLLSGDHSDVVKKIGKELGIKQAIGDLRPQDKVREIEKLRRTIQPVLMVGDGINDAPALAAADIGIAMGSHGMTAASETADVVITVDTLSRVQEAFAISHHTLKVAKQGILFGMGTSIVLMLFASIGAIPPVVGAFVQEGLDVVVILNALRVYAYRPQNNSR
ncbi:MAG: heavy metal translocating P-type ATPase [Patescibacteria group bacterium]